MLPRGRRPIGGSLTSADRVKNTTLRAESAGTIRLETAGVRRKFQNER